MFVNKMMPMRIYIVKENVQYYTDFRDRVVHFNSMFMGCLGDVWR